VNLAPPDILGRGGKEVDFDEALKSDARGMQGVSLSVLGFARIQ
jgi:hypothetical protein